MFISRDLQQNTVSSSAQSQFCKAGSTDNNNILISKLLVNCELLASVNGKRELDILNLPPPQTTLNLLPPKGIRADNRCYKGKYRGVVLRKNY